MPRVSVIMPVFNGAEFLRAAIDSVLAQTFRDFDLLVVDDGSTDGSAAIVRSYNDPRVRLLQQPHQTGISASLNAGIAASTGPLIARQDADDRSMPERFERQLAFFDRHPQLAIAGTQGIIIDEQHRRRGTIERPVEPVSVKWHSLFETVFIHTSVMYRRDVVVACGGYIDRPRPFTEDFALWSEMLRRHEGRNLPEQLVQYRVRESSTTWALSFGKADAAFQAEFEAVMCDLVTENLVSLFGEEARADGPLLSRVSPGVKAHDVAAFCRAFDRWLAAFEQRYPAETATRDFRLMLARLYDAIAYKITPPSRRLSLRVYTHALRQRPALATELSWAHAVALVTFGRRLRHRAHQLRAVDRPAA
jgi:glycosyltransferase involved in cell wall biosynthesis